jgi:serine/threonine protein kinase
MNSPRQRPGDIYALGVILYEILTGQSPLGGGSDFMEQVLAGAVIPPRRINRSIPAPLEAICLKAMAKDSAARFATAGELAAALRDFLRPRKKAFWK